jgi:hypothetical protein
MSIMTMACGCTFDCDWVEMEHRKNGPPYHLPLKRAAELTVSPMAETSAKGAPKEEKPKKKED